MSATTGAPNAIEPRSNFPSAYLVTATISGPIYGKLSDLFGRRPLFRSA